MSKLDTLRRLIREEVKAAIQEQLAEILKEAITVNSTVKQQITETEKPKKQAIPGTLNTKPPRPVAPQLASGNPLNSLLAETAYSMTSDDMSSLSFNSSDAVGFGTALPMQAESQVTDTIQGMFATARPSSNIEMVQINAVPDYTELMSNLKAKGVI